MCSHKLYLVIICFDVLLFGAITCEIFQCSDYQVNPYSTSCIIDDVDCNDPTVFELQYHHNQHGINTLKFTNSRVSHIPHGIFQKLTSLRWLDFSECHMLEIIRYDFMYANNLFDLNLAHNHLAELKESIFYGATNLHRINLSHNKISRLSNTTFNNLNNLAHIDLSHNEIKTIVSNVFSNLIELRYIDLSENVIESLNVDDVLFANLNLINLDLSKNRIVTVDQRTFINTKFIKTLNLNLNNINHLSLSNITINIESLSVDNNNLTILETNNNLQILDASNNQLTTSNLIIGRNLVELTLSNNWLNNFNFIKNLSKLIQLDLSFNALADRIQSETFTQTTKLKILSLQSVNLKTIDYQIFSELKQLTVLDISNNNLESINFHKLSFMEQLEELYIDGNRLTELSLDDFEYLFPNLKTIDISENNWLCRDLISILKRVKLLNIQIYIDDSRLVKNATSIRGIQCHDSENTTSIENLPPKLPIIHHNHTTNTNYIFEINQTRVQLNKLQMENDRLGFELNQVHSILANIANNTTTEYMNTTHEHDIEINEAQTSGQIMNLTVMFSEQQNAINTIINKTINEQFKTININDFDQDDLRSISSDLKFLKIVFIVSLMVGTVLGALKLYSTFRYRRSYRPSYNTMSDVINENNI